MRATPRSPGRAPGAGVARIALLRVVPRRDAHPDNALLVAERAGVVVDDAPEDDVDDGEDEDSQRNRGHGAAPLTSSAASVGSSLRRCHAKTGGRKNEPPARGCGAVPSPPPGVVARWASACRRRRLAATGKAPW